MPRYDFILLDADRTLFDFDKAEDLALTAVLEARGLPATEEIKAVYREENHKAWALFEQGKVTKPQLTVLRFRSFLERVGLESDAETMNRDYTANLSTHCIPLGPSEEVCRLLAGHCRLSIVTNGLSVVQHGRMDRCSFRSCFADLFVSEDLGCQKPQKEYFDAVAARIPGFDPARALVVGDSIESDIRGANHAGLDCVWFNPKGQPLPAGVTATYIISTLNDLPQIILK